MSHSLYRIVRLLRLVENRRCADCSRALGDGTKAYAQIQYGVWICLDCAKVHVRHVNADTLIAAMSSSWKEEDINFMVRSGSNMVQNKILEHNYNGIEKPQPDSSQQIREIWIRCKYNKLLTMPMASTNEMPPIKPAKPPRPSSITSSRRSLRGSLVMEKAIQEGFKTELPTRLADFFITISPSVFTADELESAKQGGSLSAHCEDLSFKPRIEGCFPRPDWYDDAPVPDMAAPFIFPDGMHLSPKDVAPRNFSFVLTDEHRVKIFGAALVFYELLEPEDIDSLLGKRGEKNSSWMLVYAPRAIAVIGHYPFFHAYTEFLRDLYHASLSSGPMPIERLVQYFMLQTPLPPLGKVMVRLQLCNQTMLVSRPPVNRLPMVDFSYRPVFSCLSVQNVVLVFRIICAEFGVCFVSKNISLLTPVQEAFLSFLFPLVWQGVYIPILPRGMLDILDAPVPIIMGVDRAFIEHISPERRPKALIFVDLDANQVHIGGTLLSGITAPELAALHEEAEDSADMDMEARKEVLGFLREPVPVRQITKLINALGHSGGCIFGHKVATALLEEAGRAFPHDEHLTPLSSFSVEVGTVVSDEGGQSKYNMYAATKCLGGVHMDKGDMTYRSILDPGNNTHNVLSERWDECDHFDAEEVRAAFLRFFVSLFLENDDHYLAKSHDYGHGGGGTPDGGNRASVLGRSSSRSSGRDSDQYGEDAAKTGQRRKSKALSVMKYFTAGSSAAHGSIASKGASEGHYLNPDGREYFFARIQGTQMYSQFNDEREGLPDLPEVRFFTESILEKKNRSKMHFHKDSTPFLADTSDEVTGMYSPPVPSLRGLPDGKRFEYSRFPVLDIDNLGPERSRKVLVEGPEMRRKVKTDTSLSRFVANNAQRLGQTDSANTYNPAQKAPNNPKAKGAAEYRFDDILYQGRQRVAKTVSTLSKVQALMRRHRCRQAFYEASKAIRLIQRVFRGHMGCQEAYKRRLLGQAASNQHHIVMLQAVVRMFVKVSAYRRFRFQVIKIQSLHRMGKLRSEYRITIRRFWMLKAVTRGWILRVLQYQERMALMERYKIQLLLSWKAYHVSNYHRAMFLSMVAEPSFFNLALLKAELLRMFTSLGIVDIVLEEAHAGKWPHGQSRLLEEAPKSAVFLALQRAGGCTNGNDELAKLLGSRFRQSHAIREETLRLETSAMYRKLKYDVSSADKEALFDAFHVPKGAKKRKETLLEAMWSDPTSIDNTTSSIAVVKKVHESNGGGGDSKALDFSSFSLFGRADEDAEATSGSIEEEWCKRVRAERLSDAMLDTVRACLYIISKQKTVLRELDHEYDPGKGRRAAFGRVRCNQ